LYAKNDVSDSSFSRVQFEKTGSELKLLGGSLKGKVVVRSMTEDAFRSWQMIYEDHGLWTIGGFDYVPIEPILSFKQNKDGLVDVSSGVLDLSLRAWNKMSGPFANELNIDKGNILGVLVWMGIGMQKGMWISIKNQDSI